MLGRELGVLPGAAVRAALREQRSRARTRAADDGTIEAIARGRVGRGVGRRDRDRGGRRCGPRSGSPTAPTRPELRVSSRLVLAEALIHALGGLDEEGMAALHAADDIALAHG